MPKILPKLVLFSAVSLVALSGCNQISSLGKSGVDCNDPDAIELVKEVLQKSINSDAKEYTKEFEKASSGASIRASIDQLTMGLTEIRTTKEDPQSTKNFCTGTFKVTVPTSMMEKADFTRDYYQEVKVEEDAYQQDLTLDANAITYETEYSVQPTDDGDVIFVELQNGNELSSFLASVVIDADQKNNIQRIKAAQNKASVQSAIDFERDNAVAEAAAAAEASSEMASLAVEQARVKAAMDYKRNEFNTLWKNGSEEARESLVSNQKEWVEARDIQCVSEAREAEPAYQEIARMECITRLLSDRYYEVKGYFDSY